MTAATHFITISSKKMEYEMLHINARKALERYYSSEIGEKRAGYLNNTSDGDESST